MAWVIAVASVVAGAVEAVLIVVVVSTAVVVATPGGDDRLDVSLPILDSLRIEPGTALVLAGLAGLLIVGLHVLVAVLTAQLSGAVLLRARQRALLAYSAASWSRQTSEMEGALQDTVSSLATQSALVVRHLSTLLGAAILMLLLASAAALVDLAVAMLVLTSGFALFVCLRTVGRRTRARRAPDLNATTSFVERVAGWAELARERRLFGVEQLELDQLDAANRAASSELVGVRALTLLGADLYRDLAVLLLVGAVAVVHVSDVAKPSVVGAIVVLVVRLLNAAQQANASLQMMAEHSPSLETLLARIISLESSAEPSGTVAFDEVGTVELRDVSYAYGSGSPGISRVDLRIERGDAVGVVGPSGGGKTTLVEVLSRLRRPTEGAVLVGGVDYRDIDSGSWARLVAVVPQDPRLFSGSVSENIGFHRPGVTQIDIESAALAAQLLHGDHRLPAGLATQLGPAASACPGARSSAWRSLAPSPPGRSSSSSTSRPARSTSRRSVSSTRPCCR